MMVMLVFVKWLACPSSWTEQPGGTGVRIPLSAMLLSKARLFPQIRDTTPPPRNFKGDLMKKILQTGHLWLLKMASRKIIFYPCPEEVKRWAILSVLATRMKKGMLLMMPI